MFSRFGVFCLALSLSATIATASWGQTKRPFCVQDGRWFPSAVQVAPAVVAKYRDQLQAISTPASFPLERKLAIILVESTGNARAHGGLTQVKPIALHNVGMHCNPQKIACALAGESAYLDLLYQENNYDVVMTELAYNRGVAGAKGVTNPSTYWYVQKVESVVPITAALITPLISPNSDFIETILERVSARESSQMNELATN